MNVDQRIIDMVSVEEGMRRPKSSSSFSRFRGLRFRVLGASFSRFGCFVFEFWVLRPSVFVFECLVFETTGFLGPSDGRKEEG